MVGVFFVLSNMQNIDAFGFQSQSRMVNGAQNISLSQTVLPSPSILAPALYIGTSLGNRANREPCMHLSEHRSRTFRCPTNFAVALYQAQAQCNSSASSFPSTPRPHPQHPAYTQCGLGRITARLQPPLPLPYILYCCGRIAPFPAPGAGIQQFDGNACVQRSIPSMSFIHPQQASPPATACQPVTMTQP